MPSRFRSKLLRLRLLPVHATAAMLLVLAEPTRQTFAFGVPLILSGLALRGWGAGHLVKTRCLATGGPYAHLRHPLYAGALLVGLGFGVLSGTAALLALAGVGFPFFFLYYLPYKERIESARLERRFGSSYAGYRARVPALLPRPGRRAPAPAGSRWSLARFRANHELETLVAVLAVLLGFATPLVVGP